MRRNGVKHMMIAGNSVMAVSSNTICSGTLVFPEPDSEMPRTEFGWLATASAGPYVWKNGKLMNICSDGTT